MINLIEIQSQTGKLRNQAQEIRSKEFASTFQEMLTKMQAFAITDKDLQTTKPGKPIKGGRGKAQSAAAKPAKPVRAAKFRGPNGEICRGRGLTAKWLAALGREKANQRRVRHSCLMQSTLAITT